MTASIRIAIVMAAAVAIASVGGATPRAAVAHPAPGVHFAIDCDASTVGIQDDCSGILGTSLFFRIFAATDGPAFDLKSFQFTVAMDETQFKPFVYFPSSLPGAEQLATCSGNGDIDPNPSIATTTVSCTLQDSVTIPSDGTHVAIARMAWQTDWPTTPPAPSSAFTFVSAAATDTSANIVGQCGLSGPPATCYGANFRAWDPATATLHIEIDCDLVVPGIQDACPVPLGTTTHDVAVYVRQDGGEAWMIGNHGIGVGAPQLSIAPIVVPPTGNPLDLNPNLSPVVEATGTWRCELQFQSPDNDPSPTHANSVIGCDTATPVGASVVGPLVAPGGPPVQIATVRYQVTATAAIAAPLNVDGGFSDTQNAWHGNCEAFLGIPAATCTGATVYITDMNSSLDSDGDGVPDHTDACVAFASADQTNSDKWYVLIPLKLFDDVTRPNSDRYGNLCDDDDDNDGLSDAAEALATPCPSATGATSPVDDDTDGDLVIDSVECFVSGDPSVPAPGQPPPCPVNDAADPDADGVITLREICFYASNPLVADTDGDGCTDGKEVATVNGDKTVNALDLSQVAQHFGTERGTPGYFAEMDLTKDGRVNSSDLGRVASMFGPCA